MAETDLVVSDTEEALEEESSALTEVEKSRVMQEVQGRMVIAKRFPRDPIQSETRIIKECQRYGFAEKAMFRYKRGGQPIEDLSIRFAEMAARNWGNVQFGWDEVSRNRGYSDVVSSCWDLETNTYVYRKFQVPHAYKSGKQMKYLTDGRDIYEYVANQAQRRTRACILELIPGDVLENAKSQIKKSLIAGPQGKLLVDRIKDCVRGFDSIGVQQAHIEEYLGHPMTITTAEEVADLLGVFNAITKEGESRESYFNISGGSKETGGPAGELKDRLKANEAKPESLKAEDLFPFEKEGKKK